MFEVNLAGSLDFIMKINFQWTICSPFSTRNNNQDWRYHQPNHKFLSSNNKLGSLFDSYVILLLVALKILPTSKEMCELTNCKTNILSKQVVVKCTVFLNRFVTLFGNVYKHVYTENYFYLLVSIKNKPNSLVWSTLFEIC